MTDLIGKSLGPYHILEQLGEGGMATVYRAYDTQLERDVAVKIVRRGAFPPDQVERVLKRFEREARALAALSHPNIVRVIEYGKHEDEPYLVMEYVPGGTLRQKLGRPMPWWQALELLAPLARALQYAHQQGIVHRDIKPSNILLTQDGVPMLTDFGIAKMLNPEDGLTLNTTTGAGMGTPDYMSPEQGLGEAVDARTDIYSLGVVLYEMLTGRKPFSADTAMAVIVKHINDPLHKPSQAVPGLPGAVDSLVLKALAKKPEQRYPDMGEFAAAMEKVAAVTPRRLEKPKRAFPLPRRLGWPILGVVGLVLLGLLAWLGGNGLAPSPLPAANAVFTSAYQTAQVIRTQTAASRATEAPNRPPLSAATLTPTPYFAAGYGTIQYLSPDYSEVRSLDLASGEVTRLYDGLDEASICKFGDLLPWPSLAWSPDGTRIACWLLDENLNMGNNTTGVGIRDLSTGAEFELPRSPETGYFFYQPDSSLQWSPDGQYVAYDIFWSGPSTFTISQAAPDGGYLVVGGQHPRWTQAGQNILYFGLTMNPRLIEWQGLDTQVGAVTELAGASWSALQSPSLSPDGSDLAGLDLDGVLLLIDRQSLAPRQFLPAADLFDESIGNLVDLSWSPDSARLAVLFQPALEADSLLLGILGNERVLGDAPALSITEPVDIESFPSWSADGRYLVFSFEHTLYLLDVETGRKTKLGQGIHPIWLPSR
ncbi:MAG: protein kinase domain-containing protein [Chloroflexota bacterium]